MFGYVTANELELKLKDYKKYKAYYCGLCQSLKNQYGLSGQVTLTYDMTFAIMLLTSLYESETKTETHRCIVHPVKKQVMLRNEITDYAADMNLILAYYHLKDDWNDEKSVKSLAGKLILEYKVRKAILKYPRQCKVIKEELSKLSAYEKENVMEIDYPAGCFGRLMAELFIFKKDHWEEILRNFGFYLGKFIYIMDAYDDLEKDIKEGSYNPLKELSKLETYEEQCYQMLLMMMGECAAEFEKLPCVLDVDILRNIIYDGVWKQYRKRKESKDSQKKSEE